MEQAITKLAHCSVTLEVGTKDLTLDAVIHRMRSASSSFDDDVIGSDSPSRSSDTIESFREALKEDRLTNSTAQAAKSKPQIKPVDRTVDQVVGLLHAPEGPLNWALFGPNLAAIRARSLTQRSLTGKPCSKEAQLQV